MVGGATVMDRRMVTYGTCIPNCLCHMHCKYIVIQISIPMFGSAWNFGNIQKNSQNKSYNVRFGSHYFFVQQQWLLANGTSHCALEATPAPATVPQTKNIRTA